MSSNDYILIAWEKGRYVVRHRDADTGATLGEIARVRTLEKAVEEAHIYESEIGRPVEYGLTIGLKPRKGEL